jgi:hydroxyacylglutathione hydrolase
VSARIITLETPSLGDRSYVVTDGTVAVVIDPQRDIDRVLEAADGATITHVLETHMHNDYVSGGLELAQRAGAAYVIGAGENVAFDHDPVHDGDTITAGSITLRALHTPGHTPHHVSYVLEDDGAPVAVFTGGSLLYGAVGRPDLISAELTPRLARDQHRSAHRLAEILPDDADVLPTHGFGSHCASVTDDIMRSGTIAEEAARNPALTLDEDAFVEQLLGGLHPYPAYYAHMGPLNISGPPPLDLTPPAPVDADRLREHIAAGDWVVDLRQRRAFAAQHVKGTINVELRNDLPTYLGWIIPWDVGLVLLADNEADVAEAQRMLARIGLDRPAGAATGGPDRWAEEDDLRSWRVESWEGLATQRAHGDVVVLDVRERWEFDSGHHPAAVHIPFYELEQRLDDLPDGEVWIYCATGNRATVAGSLLARRGRQVVLIDDFCLPGDTPGADEVLAAASG